MQRRRVRRLGIIIYQEKGKDGSKFASWCEESSSGGAKRQWRAPSRWLKPNRLDGQNGTKRKDVKQWMFLAIYCKVVAWMDLEGVKVGLSVRASRVGVLAVSLEGHVPKTAAHQKGE